MNIDTIKFEGELRGRAKDTFVRIHNDAMPGTIFALCAIKVNRCFKKCRVSGEQPQWL